jgi:FMN reductase
VKFAIVIGSVTPPGRTQAMAEALATSLRARATGADVKVIDLANVACEAADGRPIAQHHPSIGAAVATVTAADAVVFASPVYRATYAGVLKNFLDILPIEALRDKPVGLTVLGATHHHYLGVDNALRAVFAWFGALALPTSVYLAGGDFDEKKLPNEKARAELDGLAASVVTLAEKLGGTAFGPVPLAAKR